MSNPKSNVVHLRKELIPNTVLDAAKDKLAFVFIAGVDTEGFSYFAANAGSAKDINEILYLVEQFKFKLLNGDFA